MKQKSPEESEGSSFSLDDWGSFSWAVAVAGQEENFPSSCWASKVGSFLLRDKVLVSVWGSAIDDKWLCVRVPPSGFPKSISDAVPFIFSELVWTDIQDKYSRYLN